MALADPSNSFPKGLRVFCRKSHYVSVEQVTFGPSPSTALNAGVDQFALFLQSLSVGLSLREAAEFSLERLTRMTDIYRFCSVLTTLTKLTSFLFFFWHEYMLRAFVAQSEKGALAKKPWLSAAGVWWSLGNLWEPQTDPSSPFFIAHWNHQMEVGVPLQNCRFWIQ